MNKKFLSIIFIFLTGCATIKNPNISRLTKNLVGIWEYQGQRPVNRNDTGFVGKRHWFYKIYNSDHTFANFRWAKPHAIISAEGDWEVLSDSTLVEHVKGSIIKNFKNKDNKIKFELNGNNLYIKFHIKERHGLPANIKVEEHWYRVCLPSFID